MPETRESAMRSLAEAERKWAWAHELGDCEGAPTFSEVLAAAKAGEGQTVVRLMKRTNRTSAYADWHAREVAGWLAMVYGPFADLDEPAWIAAAL